MLHEMGLVQLYSTPKTSGVNDASQTPSAHCHTDESSSYCRCQQDMQLKLQDKQKSKFRRAEKCRLKILPDTCRCGEDSNQMVNWTWDNQNLQPQTIINDNTVQFHPIYSQGITKKYLCILWNGIILSFLYVHHRHISYPKSTTARAQHDPLLGNQNCTLAFRHRSSMYRYVSI